MYLSMLKTVSKREKVREFRANNMGRGAGTHNKIREAQKCQGDAVTETSLQGENGRPTGTKIKSQIRSPGHKEALNVWQHKFK